MEVSEELLFVSDMNDAVTAIHNVERVWRKLKLCYVHDVELNLSMRDSCNTAAEQQFRKELACMLAHTRGSLIAFARSVAMLTMFDDKSAPIT